MDEKIAMHQDGLEYELATYERALEVGSHNSAESALARAAHHAAILTALRQAQSTDVGGEG